MPEREMADWLAELLPSIDPAPVDGSCWLGFMMTRRAEHNPPFYWLGRAFDIVAEHGATEAFRARLLAAHGTEPCEGWFTEADQRAQDVLTEVCAFAWTATHLGIPSIEGVEGPDPAGSALLLYVAEHDTYVTPRRVWPQQSMDQVVRAVAALAQQAADSMPAAAGRICYLDVWHERMYAQNVGYRLELTEPIQEALRLAAQEVNVGHVLTRPFQWGNPVDTWY